MLQRLYKLDHLYGLLLTFGLALDHPGAVPQQFGSSGLPYAIPKQLHGRPQPRLHVPAELSRLGDRRSRSSVCLATWYVIERTKLGAYLRAATENPTLVQRLRHQRAAHDHADLRLRRRRSPRSPA